jgi:catechol 2,3-dioxygenase-like lactoylglutathione lyase family enzyme
LETTDVQSTIDWYTRVGFRLLGRFPETGDPTWCELSRDGLTLQFLGGETPWPDPPAFTGTLYVHPQSVSVV